MQAVALKRMARELCHELYRAWENDPSIYMDMSRFKPFCYNEAAVDCYYDSKNEPSRIIFVIMLGDRPIGELQLKQIDREKAECTLSIHMKNDTVKGKGFGTQAELKAVKFAFDELGMSAVNADTITKNTRSQHVLEKVGFQSRTLDEIRPTYRFNESCQDTVPQAITAFLESADFEDAIRNAISLGGDSDTLAAITGSIAEAAYGVPQELKDRAWAYLDEPLREVLRRWESRPSEKNA